jgi:hypothetical protein
MDGMMLTILAAAACLRLMSLRKFWRLPKRQGETWFLTTEVGSDFYGGTGASLVRSYRAWLVAPLALDAVVVGLLVAAGRPEYAIYEQAGSFVVTSVFYHLVTIHFGQRVRTLAAPTVPAPPTVVHLSLEPRRLRDHTNWLLEAAIAAPNAVAIALLVRPDGEAGAAALAAVWLLYLQAGLLLLKQLFVRARMKLPARRTEDYTRWRAAWLVYHLRVFDTLRLWLALSLLLLAVRSRLDDAGTFATLGIWLLGAAAFTVYSLRERRRLAAVEREVEPATLAREFPPAPVADGRFLAGGLLFINRDNPSALVRSPAGVAVNLANASTYLWVAYLVGFMVLVAEQAFV